jgi:hypothetical protein
LHQGETPEQSDVTVVEQIAEPAATAAEPDPELDAWNAYVERLRKSEEGRQDEPGRPS